MLIPIPVAARHVAAAQGTIWKFVTCEQCRQPYAYLLELEATGEDVDLLFLDGTTSAQRAQAQAQQNLLRQGENVVLPVPCPQCGFYQADMARRLKDEASINGYQIVGIVILLLAFDVPQIWVATVALALAGLSILIRGCAMSLRFDPNMGDPAPRRALGQRHAVWGERLSEVPATHPSSESGL